MLYWQFCIDNFSIVSDFHNLPSLQLASRIQMPLSSPPCQKVQLQQLALPLWTGFQSHWTWIKHQLSGQAWSSAGPAGKEHNYQGYLIFTVKQTGDTGEHADLEDLEIEHQILQCMAKFMSFSWMKIGYKRHQPINRRKKYKLLDSYWVHDEHSHNNYAPKKPTCNWCKQITAIHDADVVALKSQSQPMTKLSCNLF